MRRRMSNTEQCITKAKAKSKGVFFTDRLQVQVLKAEAGAGAGS